MGTSPTSSNEGGIKNLQLGEEQLWRERVVLSVIVVSWNTKRLLSQCLESIEAKFPGNLEYEVIVVDNGSEDGSPEMVERSFPNVRLVRNVENLGFGPANNQGGRIAKGDYLLLLNSDCIVVDRGVTDILDYMDQHRVVVIATGKVFNPDFSFQYPCRRFPTPVYIYYSNTLKLVKAIGPLDRRSFCKDLNFDEVQEVDWVSGAYLFLRADAFDGNIFDETIPMYYEDTYLCYEAKKKEFSVKYLPYAPVIHARGASARSDLSRAILLSFRSSVAYVEKVHSCLVSKYYYASVVVTWEVIRRLLGILGRVGSRKAAEKYSLFQKLCVGLSREK